MDAGAQWPLNSVSDIIMKNFQANACYGDTSKYPIGITCTEGDTTVLYSGKDWSDWYAMWYVRPDIHKWLVHLGNCKSQLYSDCYALQSGCTCTGPEDCDCTGRCEDFSIACGWNQADWDEWNKTCNCPLIYQDKSNALQRKICCDVIPRTQ